MRTVHAIETESYRILNARADLSALAPLTRAVVERVVHASADLDYVDDLRTDEVALAQGLAALQAGRPVVADVEMVAAGITRRDRSGPLVCRISDPAAAGIAAEAGITRSAAAARLAFEQVGPDAVWVIGCAPTALFELLQLDARPALVIGLPVGFVGAAESKDALRRSGLPALTNVSEKGGSAVAAAALNALLYKEDTP
ncbi:MAG: precorrin-8X/cobalt-precorrin-8 methylmutase [Pseudonocardiales bacterium]|jgi:precorrin-8X/cobalt-precorrin-8 methylmutase|nr:precorrin-8X/cobalt-precorrin-8 methylmutase [Pseudonocardiales bacterium]MDT4931594.1 precorrin-8X/cobalt-precorrin-8 methylmutase [Pseudonocardiales bacterium]